MKVDELKILENKKIFENIFLMRIENGTFKNVKAGQFFMLKSENHFLRRPISIHDANDKYLEFYYEVKGDGTRDLSKLKIDDKISIQGALGNGFDVGNNKKILVIGGGMGLAPMKKLIKVLKENKNDITFIAGGRNKNYLKILENFDLEDIKLHITTDDGSMGRKGRVDIELLEILKNENFDEILTCGPQIMMKSIVNIAKVYNIKTEVSLEARMACGMKACVGCSILTKNGMKKVCHDGPVFDGSIINFGGNDE